MQSSKEQLTPTRIKLTVSADQSEMDQVKQHVLKDLGRNVNIPGFRPGKAPENLVEKQLDPSVYQSQFLDHIVNQLYVEAVQKDTIRPAAQPTVTITKFVPFSELEFVAEVDAVGEVKLGDYKKITVKKQSVKITDKDVEQVLENLRERGATRKEVTRAAKNGDEVTIDFAGVDAQTNEAIAGADGRDYPLLLGSNTFIPGFEDELVGLKPGSDKTFDLTFPKEYGVAALQNKKVTFSVTVHTVQELTKPKLDDAFAKTLGPFKSLEELKEDIKKQLQNEREQEAQRQFDNEMVEAIATKSTVAVPDALVEEEIDRIEEEEKRNVAYRGQTWQEHLQEEGLTAEQHREKNRPGAELRVKAGLVLSEIADKEKISVSPEELEVRMQLLKGQYPEPSMQAELDKPEARRDILSRMMTEKTIDRLRSFATAK